jgi:hypothetical protein
MRIADTPIEGSYAAYSILTLLPFHRMVLRLLNNLRRETATAPMPPAWPIDSSRRQVHLLTQKSDNTVNPGLCLKPVSLDQRLIRKEAENE